MKISNSQAIDNGEYELKLSNEFGEDKTNILIKINGEVPWRVLKLNKIYLENV